MKKRILAFCITVLSLVMLMAFFTSASAVEYVATSSTTVEITKYPITSNVITIPDITSTGKKIVGIAPDAFVYTGDVDRVDTLKLGAHVANISEGALNGLDFLETIEVSEKNTKFKVVDNVLFSYDMKTLIKYAAKKADTEYTVPASTVTIGADAFENCVKLESVTFAGKLKTIGSFAFENCNSLKSITLPNSVTAIGDYAFKTCHSLAEITIPGSVKTVSKAAFMGCTKLETAVLKEGVQVISDDAFYGASALADVNLPDSITKIGYNSFAATAIYNDSDKMENGCLYIGNHLLKVNKDYSGRLAIKSGTLTIAYGTLDSVSGITEILLPASLRYVPDGALFRKPELKYIIVAGYKTEFEKGSFYPGENFDCFYFCENSAAHKYFENQLTGIKRKAVVSKYISDDFRLTIKEGLANTGAITLGIEDVDASALPASVVAEFTDGDFAAYSISLVRGETKVNPGTSVTYSLSLPENFRNKVSHVYYVNEKDQLVWLNSTYNAENIIFSTNKTGTFVIGRVVKPGDVNNDSYVNTKDVVLIAQYLANWNIKNFDFQSADGNCDGKISTKDAVLLAQYLANWAVVFGEVQPEGFPYEFVAFDPYKSEFALEDEVLVIKSALMDGSGVYGEIKIDSINGQSAENLPYEAFCNYMDKLYEENVTPDHYAGFFDIEKRETARATALYKNIFKATVIEFLRNSIGEEAYAPGVFAIDAVNDDGSLVLTSESSIGDYNEQLLEDYKPSASTVYTFIAADGIYTYRGKPRTNHKIEVSDSASVICYGLQIFICDLTKDVDEIAIGTYDYSTKYTDENLKTQSRSHTDTWYFR